MKKQPVSIIKQELLGSLISKEQVKKLMDIKDKPEALENTGFVKSAAAFSELSYRRWKKRTAAGSDP